MFLEELKALIRNKKVMAGLILALFIPTLYSATFLWAFWNPYDHTENLQVAVVNEDEPVTFQGEELHVGRQITEQLQNDENFDWQLVDKEQAMDGLQDNNYSMMIEIPEDFSQKVSTTFTDEAEQPVIYHVPNQAKNYMISMIQNGMVQQLHSNISQTLTRTYVGALAQSMQETQSGIVELKGNLNELVERLVDLQEPIKGSVSVNASISSDEEEILTGSLDKIVFGADQLTSGIEDKIEAAKGFSIRERNIEIASQPLALIEKPYTEVSNYGNGFAPFTLSLGLFIGAMVIMMVFPATTSYTKPGGVLSWFGSKFAILASAAILQAIIVDIVLVYGLGVTVENLGLFFLFTVVVSITFMMILHCLSAIFKDAGRVMMMLLIILQITASGGTFPTEIVPSLLQKISAFLPMTYAIAGFRSLVSNDHYSLMWEQTGYLTIFFFIALLGSIVYFSFAYRKLKSAEVVE